ncbi:MAG: bifunctional DNA-formamidopyrimidine glycosylase/DNA-(apurinic or apyrimidinic site) lyase [Thermomicrobiales bacterium]
MPSRMLHRTSMPELPEVETVRRMLEPHTVGQAMCRVTIEDFPGVLETTLPGEPASWLVGRTIVAAHRRGKYLLFPLDDGNTMVIHLRMTGRLLIVEGDAPAARFQHLLLRLESGEELRFADQRKFGRVTIATPEDIARLEARLGPEPLDPATSAAWLHAALARRSSSIKAALLDQSVIAGLGNIYVDELLWANRIHPLTPANAVTPAQVDALLDAMRAILNAALANQGTTFSSFENPYGETGNNAAFLKVYGRTRNGGSCERCGTPLERIVVSGRGTTFCPRCQVLPAPPDRY